MSREDAPPATAKNFESVREARETAKASLAYYDSMMDRKIAEQGAAKELGTGRPAAVADAPKRFAYSEALAWVDGFNACLKLVGKERS